MEEVLASILQGEGASSLYDRYIDFLVTSGYVDYDGVPQKCPVCGSEYLVEDTVGENNYKLALAITGHRTGKIKDIIMCSKDGELLLEYVEQLEQQCQKQKEVIDEAIEYINDNLTISSILDGEKYYTINNYSFDYKELLDILKGVLEWIK